MNRGRTARRAWRHAPRAAGPAVTGRACAATRSRAGDAATSCAPLAQKGTWTTATRTRGARTCCRLRCGRGLASARSATAAAARAAPLQPRAAACMCAHETAKRWRRSPTPLGGNMTARTAAAAPAALSRYAGRAASCVTSAASCAACAASNTTAGHAARQKSNNCLCPRCPLCHLPRYEHYCALRSISHPLACSKTDGGRVFTAGSKHGHHSRG